MSVLSELENMVLRALVHPPLPTKNAELSYVEQDTRIAAIYDAVQSIVSGQGVTAYDAGATYDMFSTSIYEQFASYDGRIWKAVYTGSPSSFSGQTPSESIYWTQVTLAEVFPDVLKMIDKTSNGFEKPYETTTNIPLGGSGVTITIPSATVDGEVWDVAVWDGSIRIYPTVIKGTSGSDQTVQIISSKAYTGATVYVTLKA